ncbi:MAG: succinyl-diaminopimelate desuccinylase [Nocardioides sp.]
MVSMGAPVLDLDADVVRLTEQLVDIASVSRHEQVIADAVAGAVSGIAHLRLSRHGNTVVARTDFGLAERVLIAGHLDTVPVNGNFPSRRDDTSRILYGLGTCDMKGGDAVMLRLAAGVAEPNRDVTYVWYEAEEIESEYNGLGLLAAAAPDLLEADFAILMEPSDAVIEAGCQGTLRAEIRTRGVRAHSARSWRGSNAIHAAGEILNRLTSYQAREPVVDGLTYREGLNAVGIAGGVAGNVIPDECVVGVNYRFAPDRIPAEAEAYVREFFEPYDVTVTDVAAGARPGLDSPAAREFVRSAGGVVNPKFGWTDVALFAGLGVPAVNYGPGDPMLAHHADEHVRMDDIITCERTLRRWLGADQEGTRIG